MGPGAPPPGPMGDRLASGRAHLAAGPRVSPLSTGVIDGPYEINTDWQPSWP